MASFGAPQVLQFSSPVSFLTYILRHHTHPSTLIVCASEDIYLQALLASLRLDTSSSPTAFEDGASQSTNTLLLHPTLHLMAVSRSVSIVFAPTMFHLRACLATYTPPLSPPSGLVAYNKPGINAPILAILNLVTIHRHTSEYSAQGLSRSFALAIEAAARNGLQLLLSECKLDSANVEKDLDDMEDERTPWSDEVPVLKTSIRFGHEDRAWAGRTVEIRKLASSWFTFNAVNDLE